MIYPEFYQSYIQLVENKDLGKALSDNSESAANFYKSLTPENWMFAYAEGKWTIKEILGHIIDTERVMSYRALRFARQDFTNLPGFEHGAYVRNANFNIREPKHLINEFYLLRQSNILLFTGFSNDDMKASGIADAGEISVEALGYIIAGHELYHRKKIVEKYLRNVD